MCGVGGFVMTTIKFIPTLLYGAYKCLEALLEAVFKLSCKDWCYAVVFFPFIAVGACAAVIAIPVVYVICVVRFPLVSVHINKLFFWSSRVLGFRVHHPFWDP